MSALPAARAAISLHNLTVSYRQHPALHHVSGHFAQGSLTAVIGPNGAGKSTLLKGIAGLVPLDRHARIERASELRMAYLPQHSELDRSFPLEVRDCVLMGLWTRHWRPWDCRVLGTARWEHFQADSCNARCLRACWCGTHKSSCRTNPSTRWTAKPPPAC